jgi:hypothetical protein
MNENNTYHIFMNLVEIFLCFLSDSPGNVRDIIHDDNDQACDMNDLFLSLHDDAFHLYCGNVYRSGGVLSVKIGCGFFSFHIIDGEIMQKDLHGCDALLRNDSAGNHHVLESDLIPCFFFYPCFCSSSSSNLNDNMAPIFDLCFCYDVADVNTYHDNPQSFLSHLQKEQEEEAILTSFCYRRMSVGEFGVALEFNLAVCQNLIFVTLVLCEQ